MTTDGGFLEPARAEHVVATPAPAVVSEDRGPRPKISGNGLGRAIVQAKLAVGPAGDPMESEADRVADGVVRSLAAAGSVRGVQRGPHLVDRNASALSRGQRNSEPVPQVGAGATSEPRIVRRDALADIDKAASERRLAHAKDEYLFDQSMKSEGEAASEVEARLADQAAKVSSENDVSDGQLSALPAVFKFLYGRNPSLAMNQFGYSFNAKQQATISARLKKKENIPKPAELFPPDQVAAHLGKFAKGAHAFIDPSASKKIEDEITDARFKGWGVDANFVAPLDEANALNAKAHRERGIETVEDELGIPGKYWSKSAWNPEKYLVRWVIPKPKLNLDDGGTGLLLEMATGTEWGADSALWVAGGLTKGGASEAVVKAIPREALMKHLAEGSIRQKREVYPETRDNIE